MTDDDADERIAFLAAYEALGPGGLTPEEIIELAVLRSQAAGNSGFEVFELVPTNAGNVSDIELLKRIVQSIREKMAVQP